MSKIKNIILSTNDDPRYFEFWPVVSQAWYHLLGLSPILAFITDRSKNDNLIQQYQKYGTVKLFKPIGLPTQNQAKVTRLWLMTQCNNFCMMNDIDILPLQTEYFFYCDNNVKKNHITCVGTDTYKGTKEEGKFPITYFCGDPKTIKEVINPKNLNYKDLLYSWKGLHIFDHKEDISRNINPENPDCFSDESLLRALISKWNGKTSKKISLPRKLCHGKNALCRANWKFDKKLLEQNYYKHAHLPRPYHKHKKIINKLLDHIKTL